MASRFNLLKNFSVKQSATRGNLLKMISESSNVNNAIRNKIVKTRKTRKNKGTKRYRYGAGLGNNNALAHLFVGTRQRATRKNKGRARPTKNGLNAAALKRLFG